MESLGHRPIVCTSLDGVLASQFALEFRQVSPLVVNHSLGSTWARRSLRLSKLATRCRLEPSFCKCWTIRLRRNLPHKDLLEIIYLTLGSRPSCTGCPSPSFTGIAWGQSHWIRRSGDIAPSIRQLSVPYPHLKESEDCSASYCPVLASGLKPVGSVS